MSYDISIICECCQQPLKFETPQQLIGGTVPYDPISGRILPRQEAETNITFNYYKHFRSTLGEEGVKGIHGKSVVETMPILRFAIQKLGADESEDYWEPTEGNARKALMTLVQMAEAVDFKGFWKVIA